MAKIKLNPKPKPKTEPLETCARVVEEMIEGASDTRPRKKFKRRVKSSPKDRDKNRSC